MCFIVFALRAHPDYPLIVAANRDEFFDRQALPAHRWKSGIVAGKDIEQGGTWLGVNKRGQFAAITNYRAPELYAANKQTRGRLPLDFLLAETSSKQDGFSDHLRKDFSRYNPFNLLYGDGGNLSVASNITHNVEPVEPGVNALSNSLLNTPWPKVVQGKRAMSGWIEAGDFDNTEALFDLLADDKLWGTADLPDTGVDIQVEKNLSSIFVRGEHYGSRCSTVLIQDTAGKIIFIERSFNRFGEVSGEVEFGFTVEPE